MVNELAYRSFYFTERLPCPLCCCNRLSIVHTLRIIGVVIEGPPLSAPPLSMNSQRVLPHGQIHPSKVRFERIFDSITLIPLLGLLPFN
jgi:hypothetical protein